MHQWTVQVQASSPSPRRACPSSLRAGFTLLDILVTISVVGVLIAIMLPSLTSVRETAHQVVCRSNVRQLGFAFEMYTENHRGSIPKTFTLPSVQDFTNEFTYDTLTIRFASQQPTTPGTWDGLGRFFAGEYLPAPKVFYCPSHRGANPYVAYQDSWRNDHEAIVANFQYRGRGPTGLTLGNGQPQMSDRIDRIKPSSAIVADGLRTQSDFNHQVGANVLRADLSVFWFSDASRSVVDSLPKDNELPSAAVLQSIWTSLDKPITR